LRITDREGRMKGKKKEMKLFVSGQYFRFLSHIMEVLYNTAHDIGTDYTRLLMKFISGNMATLPDTQNVM